MKHTITIDGQQRDIDIRPIEPDELDRIVLRCWPDRPVIQELFAQQGTIGMAAWEGDRSVAVLHCYRTILPDWSSPCWPPWNAWWDGQSPPGLRPKVDVGLAGPAWCHACCHVGRTLEADAVSDDPDARYFGRGIGTALCAASIDWARHHDYAAVLATGEPPGLFEFALWTGGLPWTTYAKLGFEPAYVEKGDQLPAWAQGDSPPEVMVEVEAALADGRSPRDFHPQLMVLDLNRSDRGSSAPGQ